MCRVPEPMMPGGMGSGVSVDGRPRTVGHSKQARPCGVLPLPPQAAQRRRDEGHAEGEPAGGVGEGLKLGAAVEAEQLEQLVR